MVQTRKKLLRKISYLKTDSNKGPRIGGSIPEGLDAELKDEFTQYFGTLPLLENPGYEFSIFHRLDLDGIDSDRDILNHTGKILYTSDLIWVKVHPKSQRGSLTQNEFEAWALEIGPIEKDQITVDGETTAYTESKLGGAAFYLRHEINELVESQLDKQYKNLLQIGEHGDNIIDGFPWDPGFLHVYSKNPMEESQYCFVIEY